MWACKNYDGDVMSDIVAQVRTCFLGWGGPRAHGQCINAGGAFSCGWACISKASACIDTEANTRGMGGTGGVQATQQKSNALGSLDDVQV